MKKIKINWFSPIPPEKTDVANYTAYLLPYLASVADVTIWTSQKRWPRDLEQYAEIYEYREQGWKIFNSTDLTIYNMGNNVEYHGWIWEVSQKYPGVMLLHDFHLHHFYVAYYLEQSANKEIYENAIMKYHGKKAEGVIDKLSQGLITRDDLNNIFPIPLFVAEKALGVIVHNVESFEFYKNNLRAPVIKTNLPYKKEIIPNTGTKSGKDNYKIVLFGFFGTNRGLEIVFRAFASFPRLHEKLSFTMDIYGETYNDKYFQKLIAELNLQNRVFWRGLVSDEALDAGLRQADLAINLRYPSMGEVSASQIEIWGHALPSLVTRTGWYATLSEDLVCFVRPGKEIQDIHHHLSNFMNNPESFRQKGLNANKYREQYHSPQRYVSAIAEFSSDVKRYAASRVGFSLVEKVKTLETLSNEAMVKSVASKIHTLFMSDNSNEEVVTR